MQMPAKFKVAEMPINTELTQEQLKCKNSHPKSGMPPLGPSLQAKHGYWFLAWLLQAT